MTQEVLLENFKKCSFFMKNNKQLQKGTTDHMPRVLNRLVEAIMPLLPTRGIVPLQIVWGMGLLVVVTSLAMRITDGLDAHILHHSAKQQIGDSYVDYNCYSMFKFSHIGLFSNSLVTRIVYYRTTVYQSIAASYGHSGPQAIWRCIVKLFFGSRTIKYLIK